MQPTPAAHFSNSLCHYFTLFSKAFILKWEFIIVEAILLHIETWFCVRGAVKHNDLSRNYMSEPCHSITAQVEVRAGKTHPSSSISTMEKVLFHWAADRGGMGLVQLRTHWWWMPNDPNSLLFWSSVIIIHASVTSNFFFFFFFQILIPEG